jgi:FxLD family lantipeptide
MSVIDLEAQTGDIADAEADPFDLDIRIIESGDDVASLINLTDNGCGSTCPRACNTNAG